MSVQPEIHIEGDQIAAMGPQADITANSKVIPLDGATAIPGLILIRS